MYVHISMEPPLPGMQASVEYIPIFFYAPSNYEVVRLVWIIQAFLDSGFGLGIPYMLYSPNYSFVSATTPEHFGKGAPSTSAIGSTLSKSFARGRPDSIPGVTRHVGAGQELSPLVPQSTRQHGENPFGS